MKKAITILLAAGLILVLAACGGNNNIVELTIENIEEYITVNLEISSQVAGGGQAISVREGDIAGEATVTIDTIGREDVTFQNATITLELRTEGGFFGGPVYGWEFVAQNRRGEGEGRDLITNYRTLDITLPDDGNTDTAIVFLRAVFYDNHFVGPSELRIVRWSVIDVTGNVAY